MLPRPSIPILVDPHAFKPPPQPPSPARAPLNTLLPLRVLLLLAHGPRLALDAHRSPLPGRRGHFHGVGSAFGYVAGARFMLLEGLFERVGGLAFAFEVSGEIFLVGGSLVFVDECDVDWRRRTMPGHRL